VSSFLGHDGQRLRHRGPQLAIAVDVDGREKVLAFRGREEQSPGGVVAPRDACRRRGGGARMERPRTGAAGGQAGLAHERPRAARLAADGEHDRRALDGPNIAIGGRDFSFEGACGHLLEVMTVPETGS
jgi:hypothetical protein